MNWRMNRKIVTCLTVLAMLVGTMIVLPMNSEAADGMIWGIITDGDGQPIEGADLILTNVHTQDIYFTESNGAGIYYFYNLNAGYYRLMVEKDGYFNNKTDAPFRFDGSESLKMNFGLEKMLLKNLWFSGTVEDPDVIKEGSVSEEMLDIKSVGGENYTYLKHDDIVLGSCTVSNLSGILTEDIHYTILYPTGYINITQYNKSDIYKASHFTIQFMIRS
jgi:hypothetical protein